MIDRLATLYREAGPAGVTRGVYRFFHWHLRELFRTPAGLIVRLRGDRISYFGVELDLSSEVIPLAEKSKFTYRTYEREEVDLVENHFPKDVDVVELGGAIGFLSCFVNARLASDRKHVVLEANPRLIPILREHCRLNDATFDVYQKAYAPDGGRIEFYLHEKFVGGSAQRQTAEPITVDAASLADISQWAGLDEFALIADIEGGEFGLLDAELPFLVDHCPLLLIEFHRYTETDPEAAIEAILSSGYRLADRRGDVCAFERDDSLVFQQGPNVPGR